MNRRKSKPPLPPIVIEFETEKGQSMKIVFRPMHKWDTIGNFETDSEQDATVVLAELQKAIDRGRR